MSMGLLFRYVVGYTVTATGDAGIVKALLAQAMGVHGIWETGHADRGTSMIFKPVAQMLVDLNVARSHSRPHTANDNAYRESAFKTLKYAPVFPEGFG